MDGGRKPSIPQVFQGQSVLVTGATGFVGKMLLEKLLRCCPGVGRIYLVVRPKRGDSMRQRMKDLLGHTFFDRCRSERGNINWCCGASEVAAMEDDMKGPLVVGIPGDISEKGLGLDDKDRSHLELHVTIVFHSAATVRFNEPLRQAVYLNTRGTREMLDLASRMPLLKAFLHVSTVYAHVSNHNTRIEETFYSVPMEPGAVIKAVEEFRGEEYDAISEKLAAIYQNTYLCTKALAERLIEKDYSHLPISVYRPGIVGAVHTSPTPGWSEGNQGVGFVTSACASGLVDLVYCVGENKPELVPVDHVVNAMLTAVWAKIVDRSNKTVNGMNKEIPIFNHVSSNQTDFSWTTFRVVANHYIELRDSKRFGRMKFTKSYAAYEFSWFKRLLLSKLLDAGNHMRGAKSNVTDMHKKVKTGVDVLLYFMVKQFKFSDGGLINLRERYSKETGRDGSGYDLSEFNCDIKTVDWRDYVEHYVVHILKEMQKYHADKLEKSLRNAKTLKILMRSMGLAGAALSCVSLYYLSTSLQWIYQNSVAMHGTIPDFLLT